ncbi:ABC transporter substrate-binding protein [Dactylosporangium sp. NPDC051541]|uniref:ABC transporter substrate-binding protein n=1 Tax=Dactylosporangium sp. NPDC051541 TaxID=3363977 RepID=UPI0037AAB35D
MDIRMMPRRASVPIAIAALTSLLLAGCSGKDDPAAAGGAKEFSVLVTTENTQTGAMFDDLKANQCSDAQKALPYTLSQTPSSEMQAKVQLLGGQNALPVLYAGTQSLIAPKGDLQASGQVLDLKETFQKLGVLDQVTPAAQSVIEQLYAGSFPTVPLQFNIEGIFYNKKIFADHNIAIPTTLDELQAAAVKLKAEGVTPFVASGKTGWTISRWLGAILYSQLGPDALQKVKDKKAKLTDPQYVAAAQKLQELGKYFIDGITNLDYDTMNAQMLNGSAAMMYMGTWFLAAVNDPKQNKVGDNIGFFGVPGIKGYPANVGSPNAINAKLYNDGVGSWLTCIAKNWGSESLKKQGTFSGFKVNTPVDTLPPLTSDIQKKIDSAPASVLWFEGLFTPKANNDSSANAAPLLTGAMSAKDFMTLIQSDLDAES